MSDAGWGAREDAWHARKRYAAPDDGEREKRYRMDDRRREDAYGRHPGYGRRDGYGRRGGRGDEEHGRRRDVGHYRVSPPPEGTIRMRDRQRRRTLWDVHAPGFQDTDALSAKVTGLFGASANERATAVMPPGFKLPLPNPDPTDPTTAAALYNARLYRHSRQLYLGNVPRHLDGAAVRDFVNGKMAERRLGTSAGHEPCMGVEMHADEGYAMLEFREPEETTNALALDSAVLEGYQLRVQRPKDVPGLDLPGGLGGTVPDSPDKLYIGNVPTFLVEDQVMELLKAFGELSAFQLVRDPVTGQSTGAAYCAYQDPSVTELAIQGLNDMEVGESRLLVERSGPTEDGAAAAGAAQETSNEPTRAMTMLNMVTPAELQDEQEYQDILEDVRDECSKHGTVRDIRIPRPARDSKGAAARSWAQQLATTSTDMQVAPKERYGVGRVYVLFDTVDQCATAFRAIAGRQFGGRMVICAFIHEDMWPAEEDGLGAAAEPGEAA